MKPIRTAILTASYACLAFLHVSCVREDTGDCIQYVLDMQAVDSEGNDLTATDALQKAEVYLFDEKGFIRKIPADISSDLIFGDDKNKRLTLCILVKNFPVLQLTNISHSNSGTLFGMWAFSCDAVFNDNTAFQ